MKKLFAIILTLTLIFSLSACGAEQTALSDDKAESVNNSSVQSQPQTVVVPNVVGMDKDEAVKTLEDLGLKVELKKMFYRKKSNGSAYNNNEVILQSLQPNIICTRNAEIIIYYNLNIEGFEYIILEDNTIMLTEWKTPYKNTLIIPKVYDNHQVSAISESCLWIISGRLQSFNDSVIEIPNTIKIPANIFPKDKITIKTY